MIVKGANQGELCAITDGTKNEEDPAIPGRSDTKILFSNSQTEMLLPKSGLSKVSGPSRAKAIEVDLETCVSLVHMVGGQDEKSLSHGSDNGGKKQAIVDGKVQELTGGAMHTHVGSLCLSNIWELNGEKEVIVDPEQGSRLCEVHVTEADDLEFLQTTQTNLALDLEPIDVAEWVWDIGKVLGVSTPNNDRDVIKKLMEMGNRDREAIGRGVMSPN
ncbi:CRISPR-associated endoribonuclease Cas6 [Sesbania bispinosa]|nr:CRISPR-associated endoribonuclease Cas6 [Sesbania bispinosa]